MSTTYRSDTLVPWVRAVKKFSEDNGMVLEALVLGEKDESAFLHALVVGVDSKLWTVDDKKRLLIDGVEVKFRGPGSRDNTALWVMSPKKEQDDAKNQGN